MDCSLRKRCTDRFSDLPDELICQILSSLPTKDAAVASLPSKKMRSAFTRLTTLDFDDTPTSYCPKDNLQFNDRFQIFKSFVDNVLQTSQSPHLSKFRLGFGGNLTIRSRHLHNWSSGCDEICFPDLESTHLDAWIGFPLSRCGVREIDLCAHVREPEMLLSALFACETLEVLKLDTNLELELVSRLPSFRLPNLKVLQLRSITIPDDDFVGRLVSSCPLLEELYMDCRWMYGKSVTVSSSSLRKLVLYPNKSFQDDDPSDCLKIDTPNLNYFKYYDLLAPQYSVASMKTIAKASITVYDKLATADGSFHSMLSLMRAMCNVQHLSLMFSCLEALDHDDLENELPVFHNLTHLELNTNTSSKWDTVWLEFLKHSPNLETLVFPSGIDTCYVCRFDRRYYSELAAEQERWSSRVNQGIIPSCCKSHLKRIVIKEYRGTERDLALVSFLLKNAAVLEELLIVCKDQVDPSLVESVLKKLPRASSTCFITVQ